MISLEQIVHIIFRLLVLEDHQKQKGLVVGIFTLEKTKHSSFVAFFIYH